MLLSTNRHWTLELQAELDDARAEIQDLKEKNRELGGTVDRAVRLNLTQRERYEKQLEQCQKEVAKQREQITDMKQIARQYMDYVYNVLGPEHYKYLDRRGQHAELMEYTPERWPPPPPMPPSSLTQQAAQTNPYAIA